MLRVAYVLTQDRGGPVDVTVRLAATLRYAGDHEVLVVGPTPSRSAELIGEYHAPVAMQRKSNVAAARELRETLRDWRPDIVHAQDRRSGLVVAGMNRSSRSPSFVLHTYHGVPEDVGAQWFRGENGGEPPCVYSRAVLAADAMVARRVTRTIVPSPTMGDFLQRRLHVPSSRITHIDNGVLLPPCSPSDHPIRRLLFAGLLIPRKGLIDLLEALSRPGVMPPDATLTVAGDGPVRAQAEEFARRPALLGKVEFLGFRTDVPDLLAKHDALILPSRMEQQPLIVAEAMGAGKPVLATDVGGVPDMLAFPGAAQYLAPPGNVPMLAATVTALFDEPNPGKLGTLLAKRANERYTAEACAKAHASLYESLVS